MLLNYGATYPNNGIVYRASNMVLCMHTDEVFLNKTRSCSRAGAHLFFFLEDDQLPCFNGVVLTIATIIKSVMALAAEAELLHSLLPPAKWFPIGKPS